MSIREQINNSPKIAIVVASVVVVCVIVFVLTSGRDSLTVKPPKSDYYSVDDGQTFFVDDYGKVAPFNHNGKEAVRARVFKAADGKLFVGYLERAADSEAKTFLEDAQRKMIESAAVDPRPDFQLIDEMMKRTVVKRPGGAKWVNARSAEAGAVTRVTAPNGGEVSLAAP